uniref:SCP domain-containing protein n=1 Tax=Chromera velia CCMP2878 TaxID=1169474 RepID=A0A0G4HK85_9ALVE|eukprot:Cvel_1101.t1-p1 / transcript=Cvel_1101.t1 / gene=Cvel_1101 / organism=Chromera_velia_CCMP2878 / gene_product=Protein PRY1, putative / transcript_product=Protein PRY1, putative / location=Cvel_scaffold36:14733-21506(+) / protein_length=695 / sequence_SO=supercontig / SO=protein_coding / is_pseudo=false
MRLLLAFLKLSFSFLLLFETSAALSGDSRVTQQSFGLSSDTTRLDFIVQTNYYRCLHDTPLVKWDFCMEDSAQEWADRGVFEHSDSYHMEGCEGPAGENMAIGFGSPSHGVTAFYGERALWENSPKDAFLPEAAHYTAMLWYSVSHIGCARQRGGSIDVCRYTGPSRQNCDLPNMDGCYEWNVKPRGWRSETFCRREAEEWGLHGKLASTTTSTTTTTTSTTTSTSTSPPTGSTTTSTTTSTQTETSTSTSTSSISTTTSSSATSPSINTPVEEVATGITDGVQIGEDGKASFSPELIETGEQLVDEEERREFVREAIETLLQIGQQQRGEEGDGSEGSTEMEVNVSDLPFPEKVKQKLQKVKIFPSGAKVDIDEASVDLERGLYCPLSSDGDSFVLVRNGKELKVTRGGTAFLVEVDGEVVGGYAREGDAVLASETGVGLLVVLGSATIVFEKLDLLEWWMVLLIVFSCLVVAVGSLLAVFCMWRRRKAKLKRQQEALSPAEATSRKQLQNLFAFARTLRTTRAGKDLEWGSGPEFGDGSEEWEVAEEEGAGGVRGESVKDHSRRKVLKEAEKKKPSRKSERKLTRTTDKRVIVLPPHATGVPPSFGRTGQISVTGKHTPSTRQHPNATKPVNLAATSRHSATFKPQPRVSIPSPSSTRSGGPRFLAATLSVPRGKATGNGNQTHRSSWGVGGR